MNKQTLREIQQNLTPFELREIMESLIAGNGKYYMAYQGVYRADPDNEIVSERTDAILSLMLTEMRKMVPEEQKEIIGQPEIYGYNSCISEILETIKQQEDV